MKPSASTPLPFSRLRLVPTSALRALLKAQELLGLALGVSFLEFRENHGKLGRSFVDSRLDKVTVRDAATIADLLREGLGKLPEHHRPHYTPRARYLILDLKERNGWSAAEAATRFLVSPNTIYGWLSEVRQDTETVGSLVRPDPPVRRFADAVRELVHTLDGLGLGGNVTLAQLLARVGYKLSPRSVGRIRKETSPTPVPSTPSGHRVLRARRPNHVFMADVTQVRSRFRIFHFHVALVLDVFSRMPLAWRVFYSKPTCRNMADLLNSAVDRFGPPRYFVSDQGSEFTGRALRRYTTSLGIRHRFGAIGQSGSIAIIERFWRTLKNGLRRRYLAAPLRLAEIERRVRLELLYYSHFRPHQALGGATPVEIYSGETPRSLGATPPPRARSREGPKDLPVQFLSLDREQRLPILIRTAA